MLWGGIGKKKGGEGAEVPWPLGEKGHEDVEGRIEYIRVPDDVQSFDGRDIIVAPSRENNNECGEDCSAMMERRQGKRNNLDYGKQNLGKKLHDESKKYSKIKACVVEDQEKMDKC